MRLPAASSLLSMFALSALAGCVIREVPPNSQASAPPAAPPPATAAPPAAPPPATAPPVATAAPPPATATPPHPGQPLPAFKAPEVKKPNVFGGGYVNGAVQGFAYDLPANTDKLPLNFNGMQPTASFWTTAWDIAPRKFDQGFPGVTDRVEWFAIKWEGKVNVHFPGVHTFRTLCDDGCELFIDGHRIVDNDGIHPPRQVSAQVNLAAGEHSIIIEYFQGPRWDIALQIWVTSPGQPERIFTVNDL